MENTDEEFRSADAGKAEADGMKEAKPLPPEYSAREFEDYLRDIGVRI